MKAPLAALMMALPMATQVRADDIPLALDPTLMMGYAGAGAAGDDARQRTSRRPTERGSPPAAPLTAADPTKFDYKPDEAVRQQVYARFIARTEKVDRAEAAKLREGLEGAKLASATDGYLRGYGLSATNVADTTAYYLAMSWFATQANDGDPSKAQMVGLRNQVVSVFATMPSMMGADDAAKQELSEANIIEGLLNSNVANAAAKDGAFALRARDAVAQDVMSAYGLDLRKLRLTDQGLR